MADRVESINTAEFHEITVFDRIFLLDFKIPADYQLRPSNSTNRIQDETEVKIECIKKRQQSIRRHSDSERFPRR